MAVLDSGVDATVTPMGDRVLPGAAEIDGGDGRLDCVGHGTAVAGIIAASATGTGLLVVMDVGPAASTQPVPAAGWPTTQYRTTRSEPTTPTCWYERIWWSCRSTPRTRPKSSVPLPGSPAGGTRSPVTGRDGRRGVPPGTGTAALRWAVRSPADLERS